MTPRITTLADRVYETLLEEICSGRLEPGQRLNQADLARQLNVSRQPVNQAIALLKAQNFLLDNGRRGVVVSAIDEERFRAIYDFRMAIEPMVARLAALAITPEAQKYGEAIIVKGKALVGTGDYVASLRLDVLFHDLIYTLSNNDLLAEAMRLNWRHIQRSMSAVIRKPGELTRIWQEHEQIFAAICRKEPGAAAACMYQHMRDSFFR